MANHTPGPWRAEAHPNGWHIKHGSRWNAALERDVGVDVDFRSRGVEGDANAHLIAAAPDLLIALEEVTKMYVKLGNSGDCGFWTPESQDEIIAARAAVAKARGETDLPPLAFDVDTDPYEARKNVEGWTR